MRSTKDDRPTLRITCVQFEVFLDLGIGRFFTLSYITNYSPKSQFSAKYSSNEMLQEEEVKNTPVKSSSEEDNPCQNWSYTFQEGTRPDYTDLSAYRVAQNGSHHIWWAYLDKNFTKTLFINENLGHHVPHLPPSFFRVLPTTIVVISPLIPINWQTVKA